jgi:ribosomal protein S18 acetylase RimI-like enzyme
MIQIRAAQLADVPGIARVHVDAWRSTYQGLLPADFLADLRYDQREQLWQHILTQFSETHFVFVAVDHEQVVGFASGGPEQSGGLGCDGELYAIYLLSTYQHQGLGRKLTQALVRQLVAQGFQSMAVWVLAENPARRFYETLGGRYLCTRQDEIGGATVSEIAYRWSDLAELLNTLSSM